MSGITSLRYAATIKEFIMSWQWPVLIAAALPVLSGCNEPADSAQAASPATHEKATQMLALRIHAPDHQWTVRLKDSAATRDFLTLLPLKLDLTDYGDTEKVADLPRRLSQEGAPGSATPRLGDVAYYAPWGNLVIYRKDFHASSGLIILGHLEGGIDGLDRSGKIPVTITRVGASAPANHP
jgi:hypothetical protein